MGLNSEDPIKYIKHLLESKSTAKQTAYKNIRRVFSVLSEESRNIVSELKRRAHPGDKDVTVEFNSVTEQEFDVKLAGDMLIFVVNTNVVTLEEAHPIMSADYIRENEVNRYFGQIMVYNEVKSIALNQKRDHTLELGGAQKIGFRMSYEPKTD